MTHGHSRAHPSRRFVCSNASLYGYPTSERPLRMARAVAEKANKAEVPRTAVM
jgi:hypothetical protein